MSAKGLVDFLGVPGVSARDMRVLLQLVVTPLTKIAKRVGEDVVVADLVGEDLVGVRMESFFNSSFFSGPD